VDIKVKVDVSKFNAEEFARLAGLNADGAVQQFHTQNVLRRIQTYMPFRTGAFIKLMVAQSPITTPQITVDTPYAHYLYHGKSRSGNDLNYTTTKNELAGPKWDEALMAHDGDAMRNDLQTFIDRKVKAKL